MEGRAGPKRRGTDLIPVLPGGLRRAWIPRGQLIGLHENLRRLVHRLEMPPAPLPTVEDIGEETLSNYLWCRPPVVVPVVEQRKEIARYRCVAGLESFLMAALLPESAQIQVLRGQRRVDHDRMVLAAIAELRVMQFRLRLAPDWTATAERNLARLDTEHRRFVRERAERGANELDQVDAMGGDDGGPESEIDGGR